MQCETSVILCSCMVGPIFFHTVNLVGWLVRAAGALWSQLGAERRVTDTTPSGRKNRVGTAATHSGQEVQERGREIEREK